MIPHKLRQLIVRVFEACTPNALKQRCDVCGSPTLQYQIDYDDRVWCVKCMSNDKNLKGELI